MPSLENEPRRDNLAIANLRSYPLNCTDKKNQKNFIHWTAPSLIEIIALSAFPKDITTCYAQFGHRTENIRITIQYPIVYMQIDEKEKRLKFSCRG